MERSLLKFGQLQMGWLAAAVQTVRSVALIAVPHMAVVVGQMGFVE